MALTICFGILLGWAMLATVTAWHGQGVARRTYDYAVRQCDRLPLADPMGHAYNDIATVIALDGWASDRIPLDSPFPQIRLFRWLP